MEKNNTVKELLALNKNALRGLHNGFGFDYNKPFLAENVCGNFTENQVKKVAEEKGFPVADSVLVVVMKPGPYNNYLRYAQLFTTGFSINPLCRREWSLGRGFSTFCRKSDFSDLRKDPKAEAYIIAQLKQDTSEMKDIYYKPWDFADRFYYKPGDYKDIKFFQPNRRDIDGHNRSDRVEKDIFFMNYDKSGYNLSFKRRDLEQKARELRNKREKAKYNAVDFSARIRALRLQAEALKYIAIDKLSKAANSEDFKKVADYVGRYYGQGICYIFADLERLENKESEKAYNSVDSVERVIKGIEDEIKRLQEA